MKILNLITQPQGSAVEKRPHGVAEADEISWEMAWDVLWYKKLSVRKCLGWKHRVKVWFVKETSFMLCRRHHEKLRVWAEFAEELKKIELRGRRKKCHGLRRHNKIRQIESNKF